MLHTFEIHCTQKIRKNVLGHISRINALGSLDFIGLCSLILLYAIEDLLAVMEVRPLLHYSCLSF